MAKKGIGFADYPTKCDLCGKKTDELFEVKIDGVIYHICKECLEKGNYKVYDGKDWASDWN